MSTNLSSIGSIKNQYFGLSTMVKRLLISGLLAGAYAILDMAVIAPMMEEYSEVTKSIQAAKAEGKRFAAQALNLKTITGIDLSLSDKKQLEVATIKLTALEKSIVEATSQFVTPTQTSQFLGDLIEPSGKLTLISMENQPPDTIIVTTTKETPLPAQSKQGNKKTKTVKPSTITEVVGEDKVYKHLIRITLRGKYADIAAYLQAIEALPWKLYWQRLELSTEQYPFSLVTLEIYTLSLDKNWLTL